MIKLLIALCAIASFGVIAFFGLQVEQKPVVIVNDCSEAYNVPQNIHFANKRLYTF